MYIENGDSDTSYLGVLECFEFYEILYLYSGIVDAILILNAGKISAAKDLTGEQARDLTASIEKIDSKLAMLRDKLKKTQFNRKMELNIEIKKKLEQQAKGLTKCNTEGD